MRQFVITLATILLFVGCKKEEPLDPKPGAPGLNFSINHLWQDEDIVLNNEFYITPGKDSVRFVKVAYLLSQFKLKTTAGNWVEIPESFAYVNLQKGITSFSFDNIPQGSYAAIAFMIGLDSAVNTSNPNQYPPDHPLNPIYNGMHWDWNQGYIFYSMEGFYYVPDEKTFSVHMAFINNQVHYELAQDFTYDGSTTINLDFDVQEVFQNPGNYVIPIDGDFTHSNDELAARISDNLSTTFSINSIE